MLTFTSFSTVFASSNGDQWMVTKYEMSTANTLKLFSQNQNDYKSLLAQEEAILLQMSKKGEFAFGEDFNVTNKQAPDANFNLKSNFSMKNDGSSILSTFGASGNALALALPSSPVIKNNQISGTIYLNDNLIYADIPNVLPNKTYLGFNATDDQLDAAGVGVTASELSQFKYSNIMKLLNKYMPIYTKYVTTKQEANLQYLNLFNSYLEQGKFTNNGDNLSITMDSNLLKKCLYSFADQIQNDKSMTGLFAAMGLSDTTGIDSSLSDQLAQSADQIRSMGDSAVEQGVTMTYTMNIHNLVILGNKVEFKVLGVAMATAELNFQQDLTKPIDSKIDFSFISGPSKLTVNCVNDSKNSGNISQTLKYDISSDNTPISNGEVITAGTKNNAKANFSINVYPQQDYVVTTMPAAPPIQKAVSESDFPAYKAKLVADDQSKVAAGEKMIKDFTTSKSSNMSLSILQNQLDRQNKILEMDKSLDYATYVKNLDNIKKIMQQGYAAEVKQYQKYVADKASGAKPPVQTITGSLQAVVDASQIGLYLDKLNYTSDSVNISNGSLYYYYKTAASVNKVDLSTAQNALTMAQGTTK